MRVTLLKGGKILREYDFLQRKLLNRRQALNKHITRRSKTLLKEFMKGTHNPDRKIIEKKGIINTTTQSKSLLQKIITFFTKK